MHGQKLLRVGAAILDVTTTWLGFPKRAPIAAIQTDFPDPSIIMVGATWHAFATNGNGLHIQHATSNDFMTWSALNQDDVLPTLPNWVSTTRPDVWAPDVNQLNDGTFLMYFSAALQGNESIHCIGTANSANVLGPYVPSNTIFACPQAMGGAIDASGFQDKDGARYVAYKVDGNAKGSGGSCNNGIAPLQQTPIMLQKVAADGVAKVGDPVTILDRQDQDGPLVEAPSLALVNGTYYIFFSSQCWSGNTYDVNFAVADTIAGPYTRRGPLLVTGDFGLLSPGGADVTAAGSFMAYHAGPPGARFMYTANMAINQTALTACSGGTCKTVP